MRYLVRLVRAWDGGDLEEIDQKYVDGIVIKDRRGSAHDLIEQALEEWGANPVRGEEYEVIPVRPMANGRWAVTETNDFGFVVKQAGR